MKRLAPFLFALLCVVPAASQERRIELSPYAGGYFNAGYQSLQGIIRFAGSVLSEFKPVDEPNSGIFGARASYDLTSRVSLEGAFGFSPAGRSSDLNPLLGFSFTDLPNFELIEGLFGPLTLPMVRGKDTFHYTGNVVFHWRKSNGWAPFLTGGLGAIRRTAELVFFDGTDDPFLISFPPPGNDPNDFPFPLPTLPLSFPFPTPDTTEFSVNLGGGVKKYFTDRCGIRFDFRDYISSVGTDTVNNLEVSFGVIFKM